MGSLESPGESMVLQPAAVSEPNSFPALKVTTRPDSTAASTAWLQAELPSLSIWNSTCCSPKLEVITRMCGWTNF